ncbi:glutathione hydrolase 1 proenzyme-like [Culicoides brevitarsis]|uniref:glutathione hydrolase 1 proenzyme-like n=1 Tax=Culicoides brevitarsis TaxID=469753 RepID=UPI00307C034C
MFFANWSKTKIAICLTAILVILAIVIVVPIVVVQNQSKSDSVVHGQGGVSANGIECANIGADILRQDGSAVDAAIATLLCDGVSAPQSMGLGGGFFMVIYTKATGNVETLNAREMAPLAATEDMFVNDPSASSQGGLAVAVPGELKGYWEAHRKYGKLPWKQILEPTIKLCKEGHVVSKTLAEALKSREKRILAEPTMSEIFIDPKTGKTWVEGDLLKRPKLGKSLEIMAAEGADALYSKNGSLIKDFIKDIQSLKGIITEEDMLRYEIEWDKPYKSNLRDGLTLYSQPLPGSGVLLTFMLNILSGYDLKDKDQLTMHRIIESFKFGYARRSHLGDRAFVEIEDLLSNLTNTDYADSVRSLISDVETFNDYEHYGANFSYVPDDHGTAHISVLHPNGDAVAATSTINLYFGAGIRSTSTGIILNDEMDDFSTPGTVNEFGVPASPSNYIQPRKRPMSSMVPSVIIDKQGNPRLVVGAAGGTKITTSTLLTILNHLYFNQSLEQAVLSPRVHHQLAPMYVQHERDFDVDIAKSLELKKHVVKNITGESGFAAVTAVSRDENGIASAAFDTRRGGSATIVA